MSLKQKYIFCLGDPWMYLSHSSFFSQPFNWMVHDSYNRKIFDSPRTHTRHGLVSHIERIDRFFLSLEPTISWETDNIIYGLCVCHNCLIFIVDYWLLCASFCFFILSASVLGFMNRGSYRFYYYDFGRQDKWRQWVDAIERVVVCTVM